mmetsp:Transcript_176/g.312  ORF Transcript_176/g.312 Transcript_176/m.312 type:complete len:83 (-) Transcript_176:21-269(-)
MLHSSHFIGVQCGFDVWAVKLSGSRQRGPAAAAQALPRGHEGGRGREAGVRSSRYRRRVDDAARVDLLILLCKQDLNAITVA